MKSKEDIFASGLIAVLPSLIQLLAITSESIRNMLGLSRFLYSPELLSLLNFLALFVSLAAVGAITLFLGHPKYLVAPREMARIRQAQESSTTDRPDGIENTRNVSKRCIFWGLSITTTISVLCFLGTVTTKILTIETGYLLFIQNVSYVLMLAGIAGILYSWHQSYLEKRTSFKSGDFIPNFKNALINSGLLEIREPVIMQNQIQDRGVQRYIRCRVNNKDMEFLVSYDGTEILNSGILQNPTVPQGQT